MNLDLIKLKATKKVVESKGLKKLIEKDIDNLEEKSKASMVQTEIDRIISSVIPRTLYLMALEKGQIELEEEDIGVEFVSVNIGPFTYGISLRKTGENITMHPHFASDDGNGDPWPSELFEDKLHKNINLIETFCDEMNEDDYSLLYNTFQSIWSNNIFDTVTNSWLEPSDDKTAHLQLPGLVDEELSFNDVKNLLVIHVLSIIYYLIHLYKKVKDDNSTDASQINICKVSMLEGEYYYSPLRNLGEDDDFIYINFIPSKEYKMTIKNDSLSYKFTEDMELSE